MEQGLEGTVSDQKQPTAAAWGRPSPKAPAEPPGAEVSRKLQAGGVASTGLQVSLTCLLCAPHPTCRGLCSVRR